MGNAETPDTIDMSPIKGGVYGMLCDIWAEIYSKEELNLIKEHGNYFIDEVERTGRIIYEKAS
ncbi:MAG: hypothetical protein LBP76_15130 [Treponema sp.]|jgi:hypothetical protein|nr:hypothetical protein [Treponema sp.]